MLENESVGMVDSAGNTGTDVSFREAMSQELDRMERPEEDNREETVETKTEAPKEELRTEAPAPVDEPLDWDKLDPRAKKAYLDAKSSYENYRSFSDKKINELTEKSTKLTEYEQKAKYFDDINNRYLNDPDFRRVIDERLGNRPQVDPALQNDPLYGVIAKMQEQYDQRMRSMQEFIDSQKNERAEMQRQREAQEIESKVQAIEKSAFDEFKQHMGREVTAEDKARIYKHIEETKIYDGRAAVRDLLLPEIIKAQKQAALEEQMTKKTKATKPSVTQPANAKSEGKASSFREFLSEKLGEFGYN